MIMNVILFHIVLHLIFIAGFSGSTTSRVINTNDIAECQSWQNIKNFLHQDKSENINCVVNSNCTGLGCSGKYKDLDFKVDVNINACETPVTLDITLNIPQLLINNSKHTLSDGQQFKLPKLISPSDVSVEASIKHQKQVVFIAIVLKQYVERTRNWTLLPLLQNQSINVPDCENEKSKSTEINFKSADVVPTNETTLTTSTVRVPKKSCSEKNDCRPFEICMQGECTCDAGMVRDNSDEKKCVAVSATMPQKTGKFCDISKLNEWCLETEICIQINHTSTAGECQCLDHHSLDVKKNCVKDSPSPEKYSSSVTLTLAIAIPIMVLMVCGGLIFVVIKFHLIHRLRVYRRGVRSYEVVDIGNDEDDDEPLAT